MAVRNDAQAVSLLQDLRFKLLFVDDKEVNFANNYLICQRIFHS